MIDLNEVLSKVTITAQRNHLRIRRRRVLVVRFWLASMAFRAGAWLAGFTYEESDWEEE